MSVQRFANPTKKIRTLRRIESHIASLSALPEMGHWISWDPRLGLSARFGGGEWFAFDLVHHAVLRLSRFTNYSQQSPNIPAKWVRLAPEGHRRGFSAY